ncbi:MAG TPA: 50S ribosomal protein L22 [Candidatus Saccharimonadales bacterium]|jgi:large subunit ribosomal protein L22|nr:50S ribosomal protein L22 [Candidatus Saccharimonadales bacterium]
MTDATLVRAIARGVQMSPRKVGLVASLVRGRTVADALVILSHTPKHASVPVIKAISSASANATNNHSLDGKTLVIDSLQVSPGPRLKRFRAGARGQAKPYQKRTSHIHVVLKGEVKVKKAAATKAVEAKAAPKRAAAKKEQ